MKVCTIMTTTNLLRNATSDTLAVCASELMTSPVFMRLFMHDCDTSNYGRPPSRATTEDMAELRAIVSERISLSMEYEGDADILENLSAVSLLDALCRWMYRSTEGIVRTAYFAISCVTSPITYAARNCSDKRPTSTSKFDIDDVNTSMLTDNLLFLSQVMRQALVPPALEAKLPISKCGHHYAQLAAISAPDKQLYADGQLADESVRLLETTDVGTPVAVRLDGPDARESAIRRLFQTVQAIAGYKSERSHSDLRAFLNSASTIAHLVKFNTQFFNDEAGDVLLTLLAVEKMAQNFSYTAGTLLNRAKSGQLVYAEMQNLCTQWYSLINADLMLVLKLFSNLVISFHAQIEDLELSGELLNIYRVTLDTMFRRANIQGVYASIRSGGR